MFWELVGQCEAAAEGARLRPATIDEHALASALGQPGQTWQGRDLYPDLFLKAAVYARGIIQGHVFGNGNKRMGLAAAIAFLELNGHRVEMPSTVAVGLALDIANRKADLDAIAHVLRAHSVPVEQ